MTVEPVVLEGAVVRLEPLSLDHHAGLCEVGLDPDLWRWTGDVIRTPEEMRAYIEAALLQQAEGAALPFVVIERSSGRAIGSTRYAAIEPAHRRLEIGWTWYGQPWQRTAVNTESKYLLLRHAFETLGCIRVEFKTDALNERSRTALLRIGATEEGILRHHMIAPGGRLRDSVYYSIIAPEWPAVKAKLEGWLGRGPGEGTSPYLEEAYKSASAPTPANEELEAVRLSYLPAQVKVLLVGESPPANGTFFYKADSNLYRATLEAFRGKLPGVCNSDFLSTFQRLGWYVEELSHRQGLNRLSDQERGAERRVGIPRLAKRLKSWRPRIIVVVVEEITEYVRQALRQSGVEGIDFRTLPFPLPRYRRRYISGLQELIGLLQHDDDTSA